VIPSPALRHNNYEVLGLQVTVVTVFGNFSSYMFRPFTMLRAAPRQNIQHFCVRELGTRSETCRDTPLTGVSEAQTLVR
jgi:hypothetical protein